MVTLRQGNESSTAATVAELTQSLLGEPTTVHANAQLATTGVDAHSAYQMQYADGATAQLWAGLTVRGSNGFVIVGERGRICLHEPFYSAHRFSVTHHEPARVVPLDSGVSGSRLAALLKRAAVHHGLIRRVDWLRSARHHLGSRSMPFPGNGYQFQLAEVVRCLGAGQVESPVMPLADSQAVARTMDRLRACWTVSGDPLARAR